MACFRPKTPRFLNYLAGFDNPKALYISPIFKRQPGHGLDFKEKRLIF